jgi:hypothetical protein
MTNGLQTAAGVLTADAASPRAAAFFLRSRI